MLALLFSFYLTMCGVYVECGHKGVVPLALFAIMAAPVKACAAVFFVAGSRERGWEQSLVAKNDEQIVYTS